MALDICKNHPAKKAVGKCATCAIPLCAECAVKSPSVPDQVFCCQEHLSKYISFQQGRKDVDRIERPNIFVAIIKFGLIIVAILLVLHIMGIGPRILPVPFYDKF